MLHPSLTRHTPLLAPKLKSLTLLLATSLLAVCGTAAAQNKTVVEPGPNKRTCPYIVSPTHPTDSRGETVYEVQGDDQLNIPAVPGACVMPVIVYAPKVKFPPELKEDKRSAVVEVIAIITALGDVIDAKASDQADPRAAKVAADSVMLFKFKPATLGGKPVAMVVKIPFHFVLKKFFGGHYPGDEPPPTPTP